jgi:ribosome-associated protein
MDDGPFIKLAPPDLEVARQAVRFTAIRARGPGGQAVNKVSSAIQLRVPLTAIKLRVAVAAIRGLSEAAAGRLRTLAGRRLSGDDEIILRCETHRSQLRNREACLEHLRGLVARAAREPKRRRPTRPARAAVERRLAAKRRGSAQKEQRRGGRDED